VRERWGEVPDAQVFVQEHSGDLRAVEQILHVSVETRQLVVLVVELAIDGLQLLVDRLHLLP